jgi:hypothetical protein
MQTRFVAIFQRLFRPVLEKDNNYFYCPSSAEITTSSGGGGSGGEREDDMTNAIVVNGEHILMEATASLDDERDNSPSLEVVNIRSLSLSLSFRC